MTFYLLLTTFYLLFTALAWKRLPWAMLLTIVALPTYLIRFTAGPIPMTLLEGMVLVVFAVWIIRRFQVSGFRFQKLSYLLPATFYLPILLFLLAATISMFVAPDLRAAAGAWKAYFVEPFLFFVVLSNLRARGQLTKQKIIAVLSVTALLLSLYAIVQKFTGLGIPAPWWTERRVTSIFPYPNALGLLLGPLVPLFLMQLFTTSPKRVISYDRRELRALFYWTVVSLTSVVAIIFAKSTGTLVGIAAGLFVMGFLRFYKNKKIVIYLLLAVSAVALILGVSSPFRKELTLQDWSGQVRRTQWLETWEMLKDRPIFVAGLAGYRETLVPYHQATYLEIFEYPHNIVLNFWTETGILGLAAFVWLIITFFNITLKNRDTNGYWLMAIGSMTALLIHGLVDVPYFKNDLAILFWIVYALGVANNKNHYAASHQTLQTH